jgi:bifunctional non-homologous end joining protein LigD
VRILTIDCVARDLEREYLARHDAAVMENSLPTWIPPMLARNGRGVPVNLTDWAIEPKWDGWRCLARIDQHSVRLTSRWRRDISPNFPKLRDVPSELGGRQALLDGEVVALRPDGSQDFHALARGRRNASARVAFMAFDVLHLDGENLIDAPYVERRRTLERLGLKQGAWLTTPSLRNDAGAALYSFTLHHGWEGIVAKRLDSLYRPAARNGAWLKAKHAHARDFQEDRSTWTPRGALRS